MKNGSCDGSQFSSANSVCYAIPFGSTKLAVEAAGWYMTAPVACFLFLDSMFFSLMNFATAIRVCPLLPMCGLDRVGKSDS